jgi:hypothetical protein
MKADDPIAILKTDIAEISDSEAISVSTDDALLMSMGKKPELKRVYNFWTRMKILIHAGSDTLLTSIN